MRTPLFQRTLALDLGSKTGWALRSANGPVISGTSEFSPGRFEGGGMQWVRFRGWLGMMLESTSFEQILFEEVAGFGKFHATLNATVYGGFLAHLTAFCEERDIPYRGIPVGTIKKFITGKGNANKRAVIQGVEARGFKPGDDNEADALAILLFAEHRGSDASGWTAPAKKDFAA